MKKLKRNLALVLLLASCGVSNSQDAQLLTPDAFEQKLNTSPDAQVVDVRTPEEFYNGHLKNALNMNINSEDLEKRAPFLDKNKPVYVYCYVGGRSARAAAYFKKMGFKEVYDLKGGYSAWTDAKKPVEGRKNISPGISAADFTALTAKGKVLVDINAPWCAPCVKMKPTLDSLAIVWKDKVTIVKLNKDDNQGISQTLNVTELPTLFLYENGNLIKREAGYKDAEQLSEFVK